MNAAEFNTEITKVVQRAFAEGITQKKMSIAEMLGVLDLHHADIVAWIQNAARQQALAQMQQGNHLAEQIRKNFENGGRV